MEQFDVERIREDFPILAQQVHGRPLVYLDNAATTQKPLAVLRAIENIYTRENGNVHRGVHYLAEQTTGLYEAARASVRAFIRAESADEVIFTSGATASLNLAAHSLFGPAEGDNLFVKPGDNIIVSEMEHHSNLVPWQLACEARGAQMRMLPFTDEGALQVDRLESLIDARTRIVAVTAASNVLGTRPDIARIAEIAHRHGVIVVVDGTQGVVHGRVDVREAGCDLYAFSGHKLYGPTGIGVLWGQRELLERMPPFLAGGDMVDRVTFERSTFARLPFKFEAGTANYIGAIGLGEAIKYLEQFDPKEVECHEQHLLKIATEGLSRIEGARIYGITRGKSPVLSFNVEGVHSLDLGSILDKLGIAVRTGTHCAQPLMAHYRVETMCRASFAIYNTPAEAEYFVEGVAKAVKMLRR